MGEVKGVFERMPFWPMMILRRFWWTLTKSEKAEQMPVWSDLENLGMLLEEPMEPELELLEPELPELPVEPELPGDSDEPVLLEVLLELGLSEPEGELPLPLLPDPDDPSEPEDPGMPDEPSEPDMPPDEPSDPEVPGLLPVLPVPGTPEDPDEPGTPEEPSEPGTPELPVPVIPVPPELPGMPEDPPVPGAPLPPLLPGRPPAPGIPGMESTVEGSGRPLVLPPSMVISLKANSTIWTKLLMMRWRC